MTYNFAKMQKWEVQPLLSLLKFTFPLGGADFCLIPDFQAGQDKAPVLLWLQGGPGGTSMFGLFVEHGPYVVYKNMTGKKWCGRDGDALSYSFILESQSFCLCSWFKAFRLDKQIFGFVH